MSTTTEYKHQLIEKLAALSSMQSFDTRTYLLEAVPGAYLVSRVPGNARDDLLHIFDFALAVGRTDQGIPALEIVRRNVMRYVPAGTELAATIEKLFQNLLPPREEAKEGLGNEVPDVFISYAWGKKLEVIVNQIDEALQKRGIKIIRDKRDMVYKDSIKKFMERIGQGDCVIVVISDKYLRSPNCMFELVEIAKNKEFHNRMFPVVLADANIYKPRNQLQYIKYWEDEIKALKEGIKDVDPTKLQGIYQKLDLYDDIRGHISNLIDILSDMNTLTPDLHRDSDFGQLYDALEKRIKRQSNM